MEQLDDQSSDRKYFTQICNLIDDLDLSPLATALYLHYKRWAGLRSKRSPGLKFLTAKYKVGAGSIRKAKQELVDNGLISIEPVHFSERESDKITLIDIWDRNHKRFSTYQGLCSTEHRAMPNQTQGYAQSDIGLYPVEHTLKETLKEDIKEKRKKDPFGINADDFDYPIRDLIEVFPDLQLTPAQVGAIAATVTDSDSDKKAWSATLQQYQLNYNPAKKQYLPQKVGNLLNVFKSHQKETSTNGKSFDEQKAERIGLSRSRSQQIKANIAARLSGTTLPDSGSV